MPTDPTTWNDDARVGVPTAGRAVGSGFPPPRRAGHFFRAAPGETELGRPPQVPADLSPLSPEDLAKIQALEDEQAARDIAEAELLLAADPTGLGWLGWFGSPLIFAFLLGMGGVFGIFFFDQALALVATLRGAAAVGPVRRLRGAGTVRVLRPLCLHPLPVRLFPHAA